MQNLVDIYTKIIIAVFGFIAPTVTLLLPILGRRIEILKQKLAIEENILQKIQSELQAQYDQSFADITDPALKHTLLRAMQKYNKKSLDQFTKAINNINAQFRALNLKRQIKYIFVLLIVALLFVMAYHLVKVNLYFCFGLSYRQRIALSLSLLLFSLICFIISIFKLWNLVGIIIEQRNEGNILRGGKIEGNIQVDNEPNA